MRALRWCVAVLAILSAIFLPALTAKSPLSSPRQWTVSQLGVEAVHIATGPRQPGRITLREIVQKAQQLQREFGAGAPSPRLKRALTLAALIPVAAVVAGICALLSIFWLGLRIAWLYWINALAGLLACAYAAAASWLITRAVQAELARMLARLQHGLSGLLHGFTLHAPPQLSSSVGVTPEVGLYVLGLLFLAMLVLPHPRRRARA